MMPRLTSTLILALHRLHATSIPAQPQHSCQIMAGQKAVGGRVAVSPSPSARAVTHLTSSAVPARTLHPILNNSCQLSPFLFLFLWVLSNLCTHRRQQTLNRNAKWGLLLSCIFSVWCLNNGFISIYDVGMNKETSSLHPNILPVGLSWLSQYTYTCTRLLLEGGQIILSQANSNIMHFQSCCLLSHHLIYPSYHPEVCIKDFKHSYFYNNLLYGKVIFTSTSYHDWTYYLK